MLQLDGWHGFGRSSGCRRYSTYCTPMMMCRCTEDVVFRSTLQSCAIISWAGSTALLRCCDTAEDLDKWGLGRNNGSYVTGLGLLGLRSSGWGAGDLTCTGATGSTPLWRCHSSVIFELRSSRGEDCLPITYCRRRWVGNSLHILQEWLTWYNLVQLALSLGLK